MARSNFHQLWDAARGCSEESGFNPLFAGFDA
jgi:hypothetical protein